MPTYFPEENRDFAGLGRVKFTHNARISRRRIRSAYIPVRSTAVWGLGLDTIGIVERLELAADRNVRAPASTVACGCAANRPRVEYRLALQGATALGWRHTIFHHEKANQRIFPGHLEDSV